MMKTYKQFVNENLNNELTTEKLKLLMDKNGIVNLMEYKLTKLPPLPDGIKQLLCQHNYLTELPELPESLIALLCGDNKLTKLPTLPKGLRDLGCSKNQLEYLPTLPESLKILYCDENQLRKLPILPNNLEQLYCYNNPITKYDLPFPKTLKSLSCDNLYGFTNMDEYKKWLKNYEFRKQNPDLATLDDIGLL